jgi:type I restriction enzyme S subunit
MGINKWHKKPLKSLCTRIGDGLHGTPAYDESSEFYFINGNNLKNGKIEITNNTNTVTKEDFNKNFIPLNENTLLLSINGTLGSMAFYNDEKIMLGKSAAYINFKEDVNKFYYYYFQLKEIQEYFHNVATGSTIKNLSLKSIQDFEVPTPDKIELENISNVLSALDSKIELNNKINKELETMAKTLYDYWFVQFDFPNENGKPYKSSGGKMVYSKELKREIPEGWIAKTIGNYAEVKRGDLITEKESEEGNIKVVAAGINYSYLHSKSNRKENTITISGSGANAGHINFWREPIFASDCTTVRGQSDIDTLIIFNYLNLLQEYIYSQAKGSAQPHVYPEDIKQLYIPIVPDKLKTKFGAIVLPLNKKIAITEQQNQELTKLRDWLLPMLMNGQVRVK